MGSEMCIRDRYDPWGHVFFTIMGQNGSHFLSTMAVSNETEIQPMFMLKNQGILRTKTTISTNSSDEWLHSCLSFAKNVSLIQMQWVVNGVLVKNETASIDGNEPQSFQGRIVLGVVFDNNHPLPWISENFDLTNFNIFCSALSIDKMQAFTNKEYCLLYTSPSPRDS